MIKRLLFVLLPLVCVALLCACAPIQMPAPAASDTPAPTATVAPSETPQPTATPLPTETPTATPTPMVWEIWFDGVPCKGQSICGPGPDTVSSAYSILSNGSGFHLIADTWETVFLKPTLLGPNDINKSYPPQFWPQESPDGKTTLYAGEKGILYLLNNDNRSSKVLFQAEAKPDTLYWILVACWSLNGDNIRFVLGSREGIYEHPLAIYNLNKHDNQPELLFLIDDLFIPSLSTCSPDGQEVVLSNGFGDANHVGLYIINLNIGKWRQILDDYSVLYTWPPQPLDRP